MVDAFGWWHVTVLSFFDDHDVMKTNKSVLDRLPVRLAATEVFVPCERCIHALTKVHSVATELLRRFTSQYPPMAQPQEAKPWSSPRISADVLSDEATKIFTWTTHLSVPPAFKFHESVLVA